VRGLRRLRGGRDVFVLVERGLDVFRDEVSVDHLGLDVDLRDRPLGCVETSIGCGAIERAVALLAHVPDAQHGQHHQVQRDGHHDPRRVLRQVAESSERFI
jgi:hypothetical protein